MSGHAEMSQTAVDIIEQPHLRTDLPRLAVGDTVDVHLRIIEGAKERIQVFNGIIISFLGRGINKTITVRRIVANEGVERVLPLHSPRIAKIEVKHHGHTRRAKLYYLRERAGKKRRLRDRRRGLGQVLHKDLPAETQVKAEGHDQAGVDSENESAKKSDE